MAPSTFNVRTPYLKGLRITRHNNVVNLITHTLQANKHTRYYTLTNACNLNNTNHTTRETVTNSTKIQHKTVEGFCCFGRVVGSFCNMNMLYEICWTGHV